MAPTDDEAHEGWEEVHGVDVLGGGGEEEATGAGRRGQRWAADVEAGFLGASSAAKEYSKGSSKVRRSRRHESGTGAEDEQARRSEAAEGEGAGAGGGGERARRKEHASNKHSLTESASAAKKASKIAKAARRLDKEDRGGRRRAVEQVPSPQIRAPYTYCVGLHNVLRPVPPTKETCSATKEPLYGPARGRPGVAPCARTGVTRPVTCRYWTRATRPVTQHM